MKSLIWIFLFAASTMISQTVVNVGTVTLSDEQVLALTKDYVAYSSDTNNPSMTKTEWFKMSCTNMILSAANRRVAVHNNASLQQIAAKWATMTPAQRSNVLEVIPKY